MSLLSFASCRPERPVGRGGRREAARPSMPPRPGRRRVRVQRVLPPGGGPESWTMIGADRRPVEPVERYLAWLSRIERSPNTVPAYAQDLKSFWMFLEARGLCWDRMTLEQVGEFTGWLRRPADVIVLASGRPRRSARTVNRMLAASFGFYELHARHGVEVARALVDHGRSGRGGYKPFPTGSPAPSRAGGLGGCARSGGCRGRCRAMRSRR
jgi:integrase/recombinase XerD